MNHWLKLTDEEALKKYGICGQYGYFFGTDNNGFNFWHPRSGFGELFDSVLSWNGFIKWRSVFGDHYVDWQPIHELHLEDCYGSEILWTEDKCGRNIQIIKGQEVIEWCRAKKKYIDDSDSYNRFVDYAYLCAKNSYVTGRDDRELGLSRDLKMTYINEHRKAHKVLVDIDREAYNLGYDDLPISSFSHPILYFRLPWYTDEQVFAYRNDPWVVFNDSDWEIYCGPNRKYKSIHKYDKDK